MDASVSNAADPEIRLSRRSALPLYQQLREQLREKIESGTWAPGYKFASETDLAARFKVSRATVRQAFQLLENDGLIERLHGTGTFVGRPKIAQNIRLLFSLRSSLAPAGVEFGSYFVHLKRIIPRQSTAMRLGLDEGEEVFEMKRVALADNEPLGSITIWLPVRLFPGLDSGDPTTLAPLLILEEYFGKVTIRQHREIEVTILDENESRLLKANAGAPAILLTQLSCFESGQPYEYRETVLRGDRCKYYLDVDFDYTGGDRLPY